MPLAAHTILLVESDAVLAAALAGQLVASEIGQIRQADGGEAALRILQTESIQLVVSELSMPGMGGLALLEAMRLDEKLAEIPFVLMSEGLDRQSAERAIRLGIGDLLVKPFTTKRLLERIERVLLRGAETANAAVATAEERSTILVVDDTPDNLQLVAGLFRDQFKVKLAHNGEKAIAICQSDAPPDLVLLDVMMPDMDGFEVARRLRQHHASEHTPIIFVTALTDNASREKGLDLGAVDYVFKPIDPALLRIRVRNLMRYVEHRKQLQLDYDRMRELATLRTEMDRLMTDSLTRPLKDAMPALQQLARDTGLNDQQHRDAVTAHYAASQTLALVDLTSELIKLEAQDLVSSSERVAVVRLLNELVEQFQAFTEGKALSITVSANRLETPDALEAWVDLTLCRSLLCSVLQQACELAPPQSRIELWVERTGLARILIDVAAPMPSAIRERFFQKVDGRLGGGYAARKLAKFQGGDIAFDDSDVDHRTRLVVTLPLAP
ncbi:MAG: response regulator [Burkholderiales bacterium]|nr:response regulator [Burkholderiales bacterium]